jgi:hypothetical protein
MTNLNQNSCVFWKEIFNFWDIKTHFSQNSLKYYWKFPEKKLIDLIAWKSPYPIVHVRSNGPRIISCSFSDMWFIFKLQKRKIYTILYNIYTTHSDNRWTLNKTLTWGGSPLCMVASFPLLQSHAAYQLPNSSIRHQSPFAPMSPLFPLAPTRVTYFHY